MDSTDNEQLILVNEANRMLGVGGKLLVHRSGQLHRAFSIFLRDIDGRILLQKRQTSKYHSGGLWANSCCGHPRPGEATRAAALRRLSEELGLSAALRSGFRTRYHEVVGHGLVENELVYVYFGLTTARPQPDPKEVEETMLIELSALIDWAKTRPNEIAVWLRHYLDRHLNELQVGLRIRLHRPEASGAQPT